MDRDKSGEISIDEFFRTFDLDWSTFGKNIFAAMDVSGDNRIEFVVRSAFSTGALFRGVFVNYRNFSWDCGIIAP